MNTYANNTFHPAINVGINIWLMTTDGEKQRIDMNACMKDPDGLKCYLWQKTVNNPLIAKATCSTLQALPKQMVYYETHYPLWRLNAKIKKWLK